jgi:hypothetical protein
MTDATYATVMDAVFAMNAYEHNPDDGSWSNDLAKFFPSLPDNQLGDYFFDGFNYRDRSRIMGETRSPSYDAMP